MQVNFKNIVVEIHLDLTVLSRGSALRINIHSPMPMKRSRIVQQAPMVPAPCWFPLTLMALSMMQSTGTTKPRKKISKVKRPACDNGLVSLV